MSLQCTYENRDDIPDELVDLYVEEDGAFHLDLDWSESGGAAEHPTFGALVRTLPRVKKEIAERAKKIDEVNAALAEKRLELDKLEGIDPETARQYADFEKRLDDSTRDMRRDHADAMAKRDATIEKLEATSADVNTELTVAKIRADVERAAVASGAHVQAIPDIAQRAEQIFQYKDGAVVALNAAGEKMLGKNGEFLTVVEWLANLRVEASHLFGADDTHGTGRMGEKGNGVARVVSAKEAGFAFG